MNKNNGIKKMRDDIERLQAKQESTRILFFENQKKHFAVGAILHKCEKDIKILRQTINSMRNTALMLFGWALCFVILGTILVFICI